MDCHSNHSVFLRADGSLACWDDAGSRLTLKRFDPSVDMSRDIVFGSVFGEIREKLHKSEMPFPDYCKDCMILASGACFNPSWAEKKELLIFQVEPSIACMLECPGCMTLAERKERHGPPWNLDVTIFEKYLSDFKNDGVSIRTIDFQGHGEPLINRKVWDMAGLAKSYFPKAKISMCTSGHGKFELSQVHSGIDEMMFAIDGVDQESFEKNRVRGDFEKAFGFMRSFSQASIQEGKDINTIWKYILFDCNSAPEQLLRAQEMALESGVREILFVNTQLGVKLSKIHALEDIPQLDGNLRVNISNYLSNFHDILHCVDMARHSISQGAAKEAGYQLLFASNMLRRRFECIDDADVLPSKYQALIYEICHLGDHKLIEPAVKAAIQSGFHLLHDKLTIGSKAAKDVIRKWKSEEISRLRAQVKSRKGKAVSKVRSLMAGCIDTVDGIVTFGNLASKDRTIYRQSEEVVRLARLIDMRPGPENSVR